MFIQLNDIKVIVDQFHLRLLLQEGSKRYFPIHQSFILPLAGTIPFTLSDPDVHAVEISDAGMLSDIRISLSTESATIRFEGTLDIQINMVLEVDAAKIKFRTELVSIQWIEKPIIEVGRLNIQVERLSSQFISQYGTEISSQLADRLEDLAGKYLGDFTKLVKPYLETQSTVFQVRSIMVIPVSCNQFPGFLELKIQGKAELQLNGQTGPEWSGKELNSMQQRFCAKYSELEPFILKGIQMSDLPLSKYIEGIKLSHSKHVLILDLKASHSLLTGIRVQVNPRFDERNQLVEFQDIQIRTLGRSVISRLLSPIAELWVKQGFRTSSPLNLNKSFEVLQNISRRISTEQIEIQSEEPKIISLNFVENGIECYFEATIQIRLHRTIPTSI